MTFGGMMNSFSIDNICPHAKLLKDYYKFVLEIQLILSSSTNINYRDDPHDWIMRVIYIYRERERERELYFIKRHVWRVKTFHKTINKA